MQSNCHDHETVQTLNTWDRSDSNRDWERQNTPPM